MISKEKKKAFVEDVTLILKESKSVIFTDFSGLTTPELNELKNTLREKKINYKVTKKSLWPFILEKVGLVKEVDFSDYKGSIGIAYGSDEGVGVAKAIHNFVKTHKEFSILGGLIDKIFIDSQKIKELAILPSKEELFSKFVFVLSSPLRLFAGVLGANQRNLVSVINQIKIIKVR